MQNKKGKTSNSEFQNGSIVEDQIGRLPEDIIGVLFSFLELKEAGRTSVLSRRWKNMWTLTPHFNFDASKRMDEIISAWPSTGEEGWMGAIESERREYIRWVNQVVDNHRGTDLDELVVVFDLDVRHSLLLDKWISFALMKRVKAIKFNLDPCFFEKGHKRYMLRTAPVLSGSEFLSSLDLKYVHITGETIEHLLSVCPLLERLCLENSGQLLNLKVVGPSLKLRYLGVFLCGDLARIEISAPNLVSFHYSRFRGIAAKLHFKGLCCLSDLCVGTKELNDEFVQFSSYFFQLENLKLVLEDDDRVLPLLARGPQFTNLKHLTIEVIEFPQHYDMSRLTNVINLCPFLHKFTLVMLSLGPNDKKVLTWGNLCPQQYLKVVEITGFIGLSHQIQIVKYFLERVNSLEKLIIDTHCEFLLLCDKKLLKNAAAPGSRKNAEALRSEVPPGVELLIL